MKRKRLSTLIALGALLGGVAALWIWLGRSTRPMPNGDPIYFRILKPLRAGPTFKELARLGIIRDAGAMHVYSWLHRARGTYAVGTYELQPGLTADEVLAALVAPVHVKFRFPETNWARRNANRLERDQIATSREYLDGVGAPSEFGQVVGFQLPSTTLEGYLYPDTYDFQPLIGARGVIERQLKDFETKVFKKLGDSAVQPEVLTKASLVELETGTDDDRPKIAAVIENRLKKGMPLQIDASLLYGMGKWRRLYFKDYETFKSPYNLYLHKGLPPTPICSPTAKSIEAVLNPAKTEDLFYVALPNGRSLFAKNYAEHKKNIKRRMDALAAEKKAEGKP